MFFELNYTVFLIRSVSHLLAVQLAVYGSLSETTDSVWTLLMIGRGSKLVSEAIKSFQEGTTAGRVCSSGGDFW